MGTEQLYFRQSGSGTPFLLIHGLLVNGDMFMPVFDTFARRYCVLAPDLRGYSRSKYLGPPYTVAQHAHDLAVLLKSRSISSAIVLGYSNGGTVAQQLALDYPDIVSRLILACTFAYNQLTWQEKLGGRISPWLVRFLSAKQFARMITGKIPDQAKWLEMIIASNDKPRMVEATRAMLNFDSRARLHQIRCPTLIIAGGNDRAVPLHHARMLAQGIAGSELKIIDDAGHELIFTHGSALIDAVEAFLHEG
ncbi:alpha/beta fold hydrolase [Candidatus Hakubella thermalkaliphila]|uniref:alpha/beta fold hydrolase n=1 Tax=Candidatus Hakubella thermalkaliphila TaxID=2754717 RepID=UPI0015948324|nr:alpha/beta hydrolase [Candidatus Hakubella thermalkaliphila]